jgi:hypothetical protein
VAATPELDRLAAIDATGDNRIIGEFLEWAEYSGYHFTRTHEENGATFEFPVSIEDALAHYYNIDMDKVRAEREQVYAELRAASARQSGATMETGTN